MNVMSKRLAVSASLMAMLVAGQSALTLPVLAKEVTGKVVAVYHEKVTVDKKVLDKVSVTVRDCAQGGQYTTVHYPAGTISDENHNGGVYNLLNMANRQAETKSQYMNSVGGHVTFTTNDDLLVSKTRFWGYNWECGRNLDGPGGGGMSAAPQGGSTPPAAVQQPAPVQPAAAPPSSSPSPRRGLGRFGF
ncbi:MAG: hypothetical protein KC476_00780 [Cyanobacteria bacterium HKST-UBA06]|nr:hypothetical protein [Cyanobacteria bacterium HKST-UBA06]